MEGPQEAVARRGPYGGGEVRPWEHLDRASFCWLKPNLLVLLSM